MSPLLILEASLGSSLRRPPAEVGVCEVDRHPMDPCPRGAKLPYLSPVAACSDKSVLGELFGHGPIAAVQAERSNEPRMLFFTERGELEVQLQLSTLRSIFRFPVPLAVQTPGPGLRFSVSDW